GRGLWSYMWANRRELLSRTLEHLYLSGASLILGILVAVPLGLVLERRRRTAESFIRLVGTSQTIPSLALLAFMVPFFGVGELPAIVALWLYAIFPILRNTYTGLRDAGPDAVQAAVALGMTPAQVLRQVRLPLAAPIIMAGVRTAAVITVGTATLAAFIGAGGLGEPIVSGVQSVDRTVILSGALPAAALAILVDGVLGLMERRLRPRGLEKAG
ncbi:MAG: ABC transporter permease, partial [Candidatus Krumholzibacteriia bacterium]